MAPELTLAEGIDGISEGQFFAFVVRGGSMAPSLHDGDVAIAKRNAAVRFHAGEIGLFRAKRGTVQGMPFLCHRVLWDARRGGQGRVLHKGDSGLPGRLQVPDGWEVVGRVEGVVRGDSIHPLSGRLRGAAGLAKSLARWSVGRSRHA